MKSLLLCTCAAIGFFAIGAISLNAQSTDITYQGQLQNNGSPANGSYNLTFTLFSTNSDGIAYGSVTNDNVGVTNGLFTVVLDGGQLAGGFSPTNPMPWPAPSWLQIGVESSGATGFTTLSPLQEVTAAPYAISAENSAILASGVALGAGLGNSISTSSTTYAFVGGGAGNAIEASSSEAFIGAGQSNAVTGPFAFVGAGLQNQALAPGATVAGGQDNSAGGTNGFIGAGADNSDFDYDVVCGGQSNAISAGNSFIGGGTGNSIGSGSINSGIVDGYNNQIENNAPYSFIGGGQTNVIASPYGFIGGGSYNYVSGTNNSIVGGYGNRIYSMFDNGATPSTIGGGSGNVIINESGITPNSDVIAGGIGNEIDVNNQSTISGGASNVVRYLSDYSTVGGGVENFLNSMYGTIAGGNGNRINSFEDGGTFCPGPTISGGIGNYINESGEATIGGGNNNQILTSNGNNRSACATIAGGSENTIEPYGAFCTISGGSGNTVLAQLTLFGIGSTAGFSTIGGGMSNFVDGTFSTIPGGLDNIATNYAFAAGYNAQATNSGAFVWSDGTGTATTSFTNNQFMARASGGVVFLSSTAASPTSYATGSAGVALKPGATAWSTVSDRNVKKNFEPVDTVALLNKLTAIPIQQWNYKWESDSDVPNIGPMAQDFKHAFYPGRDDKSISTLEFDGVELAAIQGLNQKLETDNAELKQENDSLAKRLGELETEVQALERKN